MNTKIKLLSLIIMSLYAMTAVGSEEDAVDTSQWKCKFCAFEEGFSGTVDLGVGNVSDDSYKFGEYSGMNQQGAYLIGNASLRMRNDDAVYWNFDANNLGLDSRSISAEGGKQGTYKITFSYAELPHFISDSSSTPFLGAGSDTLTLPGTWVRAATTGAMTDLGNSLHAENIDTSRKRLGIGAALIASEKWTYAVNYRHETKEGTKVIAGAFQNVTAQLLMPVDYTTQQMDVSATYTDKNLQAKFAYYGSLFSDNNASLTWDNPYTGTADTGQLALPPDNQFHQIMATLGYQISDATRATADLALGRMTQNENFLDATTNTTLTGYPFALPENSLDGRVDTTNANLRISTAMSSALRLNASYAYNDHSDKTPQANFTWVTTDVNPNATTRTNLPYSFTQGTLKLNGDYRFTAKTKASVGLDNATNERTYQEVSKTTENTLWAKASTRAISDFDVSFKAAHGERTIDNYEVLPWLSPVENPLLRKYNMADRTRELGGVRVDWSGKETVTAGFGVDYANDDYTQSQVGLTQSQDVTYSADASTMLAEKTSLFVFVNREIIDSQQAGSASASFADWTAKNNDVVNTAGLGVKHNVIADRLDVGANYNISRSNGAVTVNAGIAAAPFPDMTTKVGSLKLYANYKLQDNMTLNGTYWYEHYDSQSWIYDGVAAATINNVLALGTQSPSYYMSAVMLSMRYKF